MKNYMKGLTLLEILLVVTVCAVIITLSLIYFSEARLGVDVTHAMNQIKKITHVSYSWLEMQPQENFSDQPNGQAISLAKLIQSGLLEDIKADTMNPWGGKILVQPGSNPNLVQIILTKVPQAACLNLEHRLRAINKTPVLEMCKKEGVNNFVGEF
jgi:hypothetical protein